MARATEKNESPAANSDRIIRVWEREGAGKYAENIFTARVGSSDPSRGTVRERRDGTRIRPRGHAADGLEQLGRVRREREGKRYSRHRRVDGQESEGLWLGIRGCG